MSSSHSVNNNNSNHFLNFTPSPSKLEVELQELAKDVNSVVKKYFENQAQLSNPQNAEAKQQIEQGLAAFLDIIRNSEPKVRWDEFFINHHLNLVAPALLPVRTGINGIPRIPRLGFYDETYEMGSTSLIARLHPDQMANFPKEIVEAIGDRNGKKIDLFMHIQNVGSIVDKLKKRYLPQQFNLITHTWTQPQYMFGQDKTVDAEMGIYCPQNIYPIHTNDGIPFHSMKKLPVTLHPMGEEEKVTAFSPNDAHVGIDSNHSFSSFWSLVKVDNRVVATKHVLLNQIDSEVERIDDAISNATSIKQMLQSLESIKTNKIKELTEIAHNFRINSQSNHALIANLPENHRNMIYLETYLTKWHDKQQNPPHADFGRAAFERSADLNSQWHCSSVERGEIVEKYAKKLEENWNQLIGGIRTLFAPTKESSPSKEQEEKIKLLTPIADAFAKNDKELGFSLFNSIENDALKNAIYTLVWEESLCPDIWNFGCMSFHASQDINENQRCSNQRRARIIRYYMHSI